MTDLNPNSTHVWVALYSDKSGAAVFSSELECLRYALANAMQVKRVLLGEDIFEGRDYSSPDSGSDQ